MSKTPNAAVEVRSGEARARHDRRMSKLEARANSLALISYDPAPLGVEPGATAASSSAPARKAG